MKYAFAAIIALASVSLAQSSLPKCQAQEDKCRTAPEANEAFCSSQVCGCESECQSQEDACRTAPQANEAFCSSQRAGCDGYIAGQSNTEPTSIYSLCGTYSTSTPPSSTSCSTSSVPPTTYAVSTSVPTYPVSTPPSYSTSSPSPSSYAVSSSSMVVYHNSSTPCPTSTPTSTPIYYNTTAVSVPPTSYPSGVTLTTKSVGTVSLPYYSASLSASPPSYTGAAASLPRAAEAMVLAGGMVVAAVLL